MSKDNYLGDVYYEVWRRGGNPDNVDPARVSDDRWSGMSADESASAYMGRIRRSQEARREAEEQEYLEQQYPEQEYPEQEFPEEP